MTATQEASLQALPALHPVRTLMEEHRFILASVEQLAAFVERLERRRRDGGGFIGFEAEMETLKGIAHHLVDAESHHQREEDILFPRMEAHGASELPARMKADHGVFRAKKRRLYQLAQSTGTGDFPAFAAEAGEIGAFIVRELTAHIATEDETVYMQALDVLDAEEWDEVKRGCDAIGYCCFKPADQAGPAVVELDVRGVPLFQRLDLIMKRWAELPAGQTLRITNDGKPEPLRVLFKTRENGRHEWRYEKEGPEEWIVAVHRI
jgi:uncharacterized protein (DUF2249 family)/hemerythrin-like domain-containing protein